MNEALSQAVMECVLASSAHVNDYDQRSALGMARSWLDNQEPIRWNPDQVHYPLRDALAEELVKLIEEAEPEDAIVALSLAREKVNEPFLDPGMARFREGGRTLAKPGKNKKERAA